MRLGFGSALKAVIYGASTVLVLSTLPACQSGGDKGSQGEEVAPEDGSGEEGATEEGKKKTKKGDKKAKKDKKKKKSK